MGFIYLIISPSGKRYVGMTIHTVAERIKGHKNNSSNCKLLKASANKYGWDNMKVETLLECNNDELEIYEKRFIKLYDCLCPNGLNATSGGEGGKILSEELKENIRHGIRNKQMKDKGYWGCIQFISGVQKYKVSVKYNNQTNHLGTYENKDEATAVLKKFNENPEGYERAENMSRLYGTGAITFRKDLNKYQARINENGVRKSLRYYNTYEEADNAIKNYLSGKELFDKELLKTSNKRREKGTGTIQKEGNGFRVKGPRSKDNKGEKLGSFKTYNEAETVLNEYLKNLKISV